MDDGFTRFDSDGPHGAEPLGWQHVPGGDWEVYAEHRPYRAELFHEDLLMERVSARTRLGLAWKIRRANRKHGIAEVS
jgi:hypothetical protein